MSDLSFDVNVDHNPDVLAAELDAALGVVFGGMVDGVVKLIHPSVEQVQQAKDVVTLHNAKVLTNEQKRQLKAENNVLVAEKIIGVIPGDLTLKEFMSLSEEKRWTIVFTVWTKGG